jgi:hypothetical protein
MDQNNPDDLYNANMIAAQRYAQVLQEKKEKEEAQKTTESKKSSSSGRTLYVGATLKSERADRIAAVWFPLLREIFPDSFSEEAKRKGFFKRMFKKVDNYMSRQWVKDLYHALRNCSWSYLTGEKVGLDQKEKDILSRSDSKRHAFMKIILDTTNITDTSA